MTRVKVAGGGEYELVSTLIGGLGTGTGLTVRGNSFGLNGSVFLGSSALFELSEAVGMLKLPTVGGSAGLLIGGDAQIYRGAADVLYSPDSARLAGHVRVGDTAAPTNVTAGDLTATRLFLGSSQEQVGAWVSPAFDAANFTATTGTWTVAAGDVVTYAYCLIGKTMIVAFFIQTSTTATGCTNLKIKIPAGKTAVKTGLQMIHLNENGTRSVGFVQVNASGTTLDIYRNDLAAIANCTDTLLTSGTLAFEVA